MKRLLNYNVFEGDPNLIKDSQILVVKDPYNRDIIRDILKRVNGKLTSIIAKKIVFTICQNPPDAKVIINGDQTRITQINYNDIVNWEVSKEGYHTISGTYNADNDYAVIVTLTQK